MVNLGSRTKKRAEKAQNSSSKESISKEKASDDVEDAERRSSLAKLDIETDSDEGSSIDGELREKEQGVEDEEVFASHEDKTVDGGGRDLKKKVPVFKAKSFFKLVHITLIHRYAVYVYDRCR